MLLAACAFGASATTAPAPGDTVTLDDVLVTGERPGPGLWRVSSGNHDLWILGTLEPLPKGMTWRSAQVEARIGASQAVLAPPEVDTNVGFFRSITLLPALLHARKSPDGRTLEASLPHDLYIRWLALRVKYLGNGGGDEQLRPVIAALDLYEHALDQSGLTSDDAVWDAVARSAHTHHVPIQPVSVTVTLNDPKASIKELGNISRDDEIACLADTIKRLETDLGPMRQRANLWSVGDVAGLKPLIHLDERIACLDVFLSVPTLREQLTRAKTQVDNAWIEAASRALERNDSTVAVTAMRQLLSSEGYLAAFRARGYTVQEP